MVRCLARYASKVARCSKPRTSRPLRRMIYQTGNPNIAILLSLFAESEKVLAVLIIHHVSQNTYCVRKGLLRPYLPNHLSLSRKSLVISRTSRLLKERTLQLYLDRASWISHGTYHVGLSYVKDPCIWIGSHDVGARLSLDWVQTTVLIVFIISFLLRRAAWAAIAKESDTSERLGYSECGIRQMRLTE